MSVPSLLVIFILASVLNLCVGLTCYSCTYVFSGNDGSYNYECVDNPLNFTQTREIPCQPDDSCIVSGTYDEGYDKLLSMSRHCGKPTLETPGCTDVSTRPSCEYFCSTDLCNHINGDLKVKDGNTASRSFMSPVVMAAMLAFLLL